MSDETKMVIAFISIFIVIVGSIIGGMLLYHSIDTDAKIKLYCVQHGKSIDVEYNGRGNGYVKGCK